MKTVMLAAAAALALSTVPALAGGTKAAPTAAEVGSQNLVATAKADPEFSTLARAIEAADLGTSLAAKGPYTLFAPTNAAFAKLPAGELDRLLQPANRAQLKALLENHVVDGQAKADFFAGKQGEMVALGGSKLTLDGSTGVKVNNATVVKPDIVASNGVIHAIDTVLLPAPATAAATVDEPTDQGSAEE
jgi:uncharacterized surface protein with fasciclin (FAS1) repeats